MAVGGAIFQDTVAGVEGVRARADRVERTADKGGKGRPRRGTWSEVKNDSGDFDLEVLVLSEMRGPAAVAQTLYRETEASRELRARMAEERKAMPHFEAMREGKPSKRDRRDLARLRRRG